ncbi:MAG: DUF4230 domain-containing protein [Phycisphaerales bacterium]|nr:DUF4230 domain-containing protein [Phycisphaerales bacterium]
MPSFQRTLTLIVALLLLIAGGFVGWAFHRTASQPARFEHQSTALRIEEIQRLAELVVLRVPISDVQTAKLEGYTGAVSAVLIIKGDVQISTDLSQAQLVDVNDQTRTARLLLPMPQAARPRLDHEGTRIYRVDRSGLWSIYPGQAAEGKVIDLAMQQAQTHLLAAAGQAGLIDQAKVQAELVLSRFFSALQWQVKIEFKNLAG